MSEVVFLIVNEQSGAIVAASKVCRLLPERFSVDGVIRLFYFAPLRPRGHKYLSLSAFCKQPPLLQLLQFLPLPCVASVLKVHLALGPASHFCSQTSLWGDEFSLQRLLLQKLGVENFAVKNRAACWQNFYGSPTKPALVLLLALSSFWLFCSRPRLFRLTSKQTVRCKKGIKRGLKM